MCTNLAWYRMHHTIKTTRRVNYTNQVLIALLFFPSFGRWSSSSAPPDCCTSRPAWSRPLRVFSPGAGFPLWHKQQSRRTELSPIATFWFVSLRLTGMLDWNDSNSSWLLDNACQTDTTWPHELGGGEGRQSNRSNRREFRSSRDCVNMGNALSRKLKEKSKKKPRTIVPPKAVEPDTFNFYDIDHPYTSIDTTDSGRKRYDPDDRRLRFVDRDDEMDCKWERSLLSPNSLMVPSRY